MRDKSQTTLEWITTQKRLDAFMDKAIEEVAEKITEKLNSNPAEEKIEKEESPEIGVETVVEEAQESIPESIQAPLIRQEEAFPLLSLSMDEKDPNKIKPFQYQMDALQSAFREAVGTIVMPTGSGKTILGTMVIKAFWNRNREQNMDDIKTLVITPQITILTQWIDTFKRAGTEATAWYGEEKKLSDFTVTTYQSASAHPEILKQFNSVIFDEVHHLYAPEYSVLLDEEYLSGKYFVIGLTATALKPNEQNFRTQQETLPVLYELTPTGLAEYGRATIPQWISTVVMPNAQIDEALTKTNLIYKRAVSMYGNFYDMVRASQKKDRTALMGMKLFYYKSLLLSATHDKLITAVMSIKNELDMNPEAKIIVFTESGQSANFIGNLLTKLGVSTLVLLSEKGLKAGEKKEELDKFRKGYYKVLVGVNMIVEGLDVPEMDEAFMVSMGKKSERRFIQKLGRILRYREGKKPKVITFTYAQSDEMETMRSLLNNTIGKKEPDEVVRTGHYDVTNIKEQLSQMGIDVGTDTALETVQDYLYKIRGFGENW